jgi:glycosyltransferase involved in cell wall biosynthesis
MRIFQLTHEFPPSSGGQGLVVYEISKELAKRGHEVTVLTTNLIDERSADNIFDKSFERLDGFNVCRLRIDASFKNYLISAQLLERLLTNRVDLLHAHGYCFFHTDVTALVSRIRKIPFVMTAHAFYPAIFRFSKIVQKAYNSSIGPIVLREAAKCIALTPYYARIFQELGVPNSKIQIIPNGIDCERYLNLPDSSYVKNKYGIDGKLITFIGRLDDIKSPALFPLLKAFKVLLIENPTLKLAILGPDWGYLPKLRKLAKDLGIANSVIFTGKVSEQEKLMFLSASHVGAVVSTNEAFSIVLLEFMASGTPIMVSRVGGLPWIVKNGLTGFLTDNNPDEMRRILHKLLFDETLATRIGEQGRLLCSSVYTWNKVVDQLENVYAECQK